MSPRNETFVVRSRSSSPTQTHFVSDGFFCDSEVLFSDQDFSLTKDAASPPPLSATSPIAPLTIANMAAHATSLQSSKKCVSSLIPRSSASVQSSIRDDDWTKIEDPVKRRQARNRLAAERSRLRKLSHVQELEDLLERTTEEKNAAIANVAKLEQENRELRAAHKALHDQFLSIQSQLMSISLEQQSFKSVFKAETPYPACQPFPNFKDLNGLIPGH
jgi:hypothetical protein